MNLTPTELARRLCEAAHPHLGTTQAVVPCGPHITEAQRFWALVQEEGSASLEVILQARIDEKVKSPVTLGVVLRSMVRQTNG